LNKFFYITNVRLPTEKAHGYQIMKMCEAFSQQGQEVVLIVPKRKNFIDEGPFDFYSVERSFIILQLPVLDLIDKPLFDRWPLSLVTYVLLTFTFWWALQRSVMNKLLASLWHC